MPDEAQSFVIARPAPDEYDLLRALAVDALAPGFANGTIEALERALNAPSQEDRVLIARDSALVAMVGAVIFGETAGARGAGRIRALLVPGERSSLPIARTLLASALDALRASGARFALVELPDLPSFRLTDDALAEKGFVEAARVHDLVADGVALRYLRRELGDAPGDAFGSG